EGSDEPKQQSEQTITISDSFDSGVSADEIQSELYEQEVSADQAAVIAQTAISQEALLPNSTVFIPQTATRKSIADVIKQSKNLLIYGIITLFLIAVYIGYAQYFKTRFYLGTTINGISISGLSLQDANTKLNDALQNYSLTIIERSNSGEQIKAQDISLAYNSLDDLNTYLSSQSGYGWLGAIFSKNSKKTIVMSYDAEQLNQQIGNLSFLKPENIIKPGNPSFNYVNGSYVIVQEVTGNEVDQDTLYKAIADNICIMNTKLDLQQADCYTKPAYTANSQKTIDTQNLLNTYAAVQITYIIGTEQIIIDASQICSWMSVDNDLNIVFNKNKIQNFVNNLEKISSAVTYTRNFKTTAGSIVQITGGNYGRYMSFAKENDFITNTIKSGVSATRDFNEIGSTYVEISLTKQHIWFYKNGTLVVEGSIVTGNVMNHKATPKGVYYLRSKTRNTTLVGPDYEADVSYWMPFNRGIGLHDATWRSYFGGSIYKTNGSHGCVNLPYNVAKKIYNNISVGTPVVVY
ncbi:MAG: L,D-transpeptidase family protein, partial [Eubacteriaceae bacterium]|nr:L,D-transpeptidase family protein [Eubacteriaceae bacterium]